MKCMYGHFPLRVQRCSSQWAVPKRPSGVGRGESYFLGDGSKMVAAAVQLAPTFAVTSRTALFTDSFFRPVGTLNYDVLPDGGFAMLQPSAASQLIVLTNWPASVTRARAKLR